MKLLQRSILWELVRVFTLLLVGLTVMLVFIGLMREASERDLGLRQVFQIMPFVVPSLLPFTIPATVLLAVTVVYGRIASDNEITAAKSAGVHPLRLLAPAFLLGGTLTIVSFGMTDRAIPWAITNIEVVVTQAMEDIFLRVLDKQHYYGSPNDGYSILVDDVRGKTLILPSFTYRNRNHQQVTAKAEQAQVQFDVEERKVKLYLKNAVISAPGRDTGGWVNEYILDFDLKAELGEKKARHLTIEDIREQLVRLSDDRENIRIQRDQEIAMLLMVGDFDQLSSKQTKRFNRAARFNKSSSDRMHTEIHTRYAMAGSCLFFTLLGGPFAVIQARRQFVTSFIMCFLPILLIYYPVTFLMVNLGKSGTLDPMWAMWVPNAIIGVAACFVLRRVIRH